MAVLLKKSWFWILSGLAILFGGCRLLMKDISCVYGPPKVYGPPPPKVQKQTHNDSIPEAAEPEKDSENEPEKPAEETENKPQDDEKNN